MERLDTPITRSYLPIVLYLDDLTEIIRAFPDPDPRIEISTVEYRFESIDELRDKHPSERLVTLSIKCSDPYVTLELSRFDATLYVGSSQAAPAGVFWKIDAVLRRAQRRFAWIYSWPGSIGIWVLFGLAFMPAFRFHVAAGLAVVALWACWGIWSFRVTLRFHSLVILRPKTSKGMRGFIARNKDQLLVAVIAALLGLIAGVIGTLLSTRLAA